MPETNSFQLSLNENLPVTLKAYVPTTITQPQFPTDAVFFQQQLSNSAPPNYSHDSALGVGSFTLFNFTCTDTVVVNAIQYYTLDFEGTYGIADSTVYNGFALYRQTNGSLDLVCHSESSDRFLISGEPGSPTVPGLTKRFVSIPETQLTTGQYYLGVSFKLGSDPSVTTPDNLALSQNITTYQQPNNEFYNTVMAYYYLPGTPVGSEPPSSIDIAELATAVPNYSTGPEGDQPEFIDGYYPIPIWFFQPVLQQL
jgi:hypothetical protein